MVQTTAKGYPYPETSDSPHGPDQLQDLASRADELTDAARMTTTERDALAAPDLYDGRVVMIVDSNGVWQRIEVYHADDPADPDAGGTWHIIVDRASADGRYANLTGDTFTGAVNIDGAGVFPDLGDDFALESASPSTYPAGYTTFRDLQGSFPAGTDGVVETINPTGDSNARQLNWDHGTNTIYTRVSTDSTAWEPWLRVNHLPVARMYLNTVQSMANATKEKILLDTIELDRGGVADTTNNQMVLPEGLWVVVSNIRYTGNSSGSMRENWLERNDSAQSITRVPPAGSSITPVNQTTIIETSAGGVLELYGEQDTGGALDIGAGSPWTYMAAFYLEERP